MAKQDPRYRKFVHNYFYGPPGVVGVAVKSALKAGFAKTTSEKKSPSWVVNNREQASNKVIWDLVFAERQKFEKNHDLSEEEILKQYKRLATFDIRKLYDPQGHPIPIHLLDDDTAAAICAVDIVLGQSGGDYIETKKIKMSDKKGALDSVAKIKGMFKEDNRQKVGPTLEEIFAAILMVDKDLAQKIREKLAKNATS